MSKGDKLYVKWKGYDSSFNSWIDKKDSKMSEYVLEPKPSGGRVKVELDSSKYDLKNATGFDTSTFAKKVDLASLKSNADQLDIDKLENLPTNLNNLKNKVDKLDVDKLVPAPIKLSKLSNVVQNVAKKDVYNTMIKDIEDKIPDITNLALILLLILK